MTKPSPEEQSLLAQILRDVARARRLNPEDAQDFIQAAQVRLIERNYDVFDRFTGRSSLRTYLTVVVTRMLLDWRNSVYGKWRPSAMAVRQGKTAVALERLIARDGYSPAEAIEHMLARPGGAGRDELQRIAEALPYRHRARMVSDEVLHDMGGVWFEDPLDAAEQRQTDHRVQRALAAALTQLPEEERWLIDVRYKQHRSVQALAQFLQTDPKRLYRRFDRTLRSLRRAMLAAGVTGSDIVRREVSTAGVRR
jgi:RNA polymerase sigma factor (sigma-70 family)